MGIAWGINQGVLDAATYTPVVLKGWEGLATVSLQPSGLVGYCQGVGAEPGPATKDGTSDFCVGLWLMAAREVYRLVVGGKGPPMW